LWGGEGHTINEQCPDTSMGIAFGGWWLEAEIANARRGATALFRVVLYNPQIESPRGGLLGQVPPQRAPPPPPQGGGKIGWQNRLAKGGKNPPALRPTTLFGRSIPRPETIPPSISPSALNPSSLSIGAVLNNTRGARGGPASGGQKKGLLAGKILLAGTSLCPS